MNVTPYAGVWIEIFHLYPYRLLHRVTPYAGVWIEIFEKVFAPDMVWSLPTRECGLKLTRLVD